MKSYYFTLTQFSDLELGHACDPTDFDGAVDAFAEQMEAGNSSQVFRVDLGTNATAPMMVDVTNDAIDRVSSRLRQRRMDAPEWLLEAA